MSVINLAKSKEAIVINFDHYSSKRKLNFEFQTKHHYSESPTEINSLFSIIIFL